MASDDKEAKKVIVPKTAADVQRFKLQKLLKNPDKPAFIPEKPEEKLPRVFRPPEFVRNIWGSSAGAGSGDFHVYRGVRRREYARQKFLDQKSDKQILDDKFQESLKQHKASAEERTAKKRAKRLKKKMKQKSKKAKPSENSGNNVESAEEEEESEESDVENQNCAHNEEQLPSVMDPSTQDCTTEPSTEDSNSSSEPSTEDSNSTNSV